MIEALLQGLFMGLVLTTFCGPIFFMLIDLGITGTIKSVFWLALSVFLCDVLIVFCLLFIALNFVSDIKSLQILYYIGGGLLVYFGINKLLKKPQLSQQKIIDSKELSKLFVKGFMINVFNPNILLFWFSAITLALSTYNNNKQFVIIHFISGLLLSFTTDFLKGYGAFKLKKFVTPTILTSLNILSGLILIGFGLKLIILH